MQPTQATSATYRLCSHGKIAQKIRDGSYVTARVMGQQISLVEHQDGLDADRLGGHQIAIDQVGVRGRQGRDDHQDAVHICRHGPQAAVGTGTQQLAAARLAGHYHTGGVPGRNEIDDTQKVDYAKLMRAIVETKYTGYVGQEFIPKRQEALQSLEQAVKICDV